MLTLLISILIPIGLVVIFRIINTPRNPPIYGVYQQKNKYFWFKFLFMYVIFTVRQTITWVKRAYAVDSGKSGDGTIHIHDEDTALEQKYDLGDSLLGFDAVYFNGISKEGAVVCNLARRPKQVCESFIYIKIGDDILTSPKLPDTQLRQLEEENGLYRVEGIEIVNMIPMRTWKLSYKGEMKSRNAPEKNLAVQAEFTWSARWSAFNFHYQMSRRSMACDIARETWSKDYFELLKKFRQTHYEQMGTLKGMVTVDGKPHELTMPCVRYHSFGPYLQWRNFHRYVLHFIFLENGDKLAIGVVSQPAILSHLTIGYVCKASEPRVLPVDSSDFKLYQHAENQILPKDYGFSFNAGGELYVVQVRVEDEEIFYIGEKREAKFYVRWANVEVNGVKGKSCAEWQYNNVQAK